jgi:septum formation protein
VRFAVLHEARVRAYCASGEPLGKAGSYAIQGLAAAFVRSVQGSYTGIVGLPLAETLDLLAGFGVQPQGYA